MLHYNKLQTATPPPPATRREGSYYTIITLKRKRGEAHLFSETLEIACSLAEVVHSSDADFECPLEF